MNKVKSAFAYAAYFSIVFAMSIVFLKACESDQLKNDKQNIEWAKSGNH